MYTGCKYSSLLVLRVMIVRYSYTSFYYIDHNDIKSDKQTRSGGDFIMQDNNGMKLPAHGWRVGDNKVHNFQRTN